MDIGASAGQRAHVVASCPGRVRVHVPALYRSEREKQRIEACARRHEGIEAVHANPLTGRVLIFFCTSVPVRNILLIFGIGPETSTPSVASEKLDGVPPRTSQAAQTGARQDIYPDWHLRSTGDIIACLNGSTRDGLSRHVVQERLRKGRNVLPGTAARSSLDILLGQFRSLPVLLLGASAVLSVLTGGLAEGLAIAAVPAMNAGIGFVTERRAESTIASLSELLDNVVPIMREGRFEQAHASEIVPGDLLILAPGVRIAAELTGLPNRHWLMRYLPVAMQRATQNRQKLAVLFLDLDEFKNVNDAHGHSAGDELLKIIAKRVQSVLRSGDRIVRLGGDEFTVIAEQVMSRDDAAHLAQRIVQTLRSPIELSFGKHVVGASVGVALFPDDGDSAESLLKNADIAMYSVKANGKGDYQFFEPVLYENLKRRVTMEQALRQAIEHDRFVLYYQPRVDTVSGRMSGMEALVRWVDPERGIIPPLEFIPVAESTGLILALGELIIDKAARQIAQWKKAQLLTVPVSINVSPRQFNEDNIQSQLGAAIARHGIRADDIQIEITESAMIGDQAEVSAQLAERRASNIAFLVDDFGIGYSSLSQLQRLEMDGLKVDRAFTSELGQSDEGEIFFKAIVSMAHALGMKVTAEGVETMQQLAILRALSCDEAQGYLVSRPVAAGEMEALLRKPCIFPANGASHVFSVPSLFACEPVG